MFSKEDMLKDNYEDEIKNILNMINKIQFNTKKKQELVSDLINLGIKKKYIIFGAYTHRYFIGRIGDSFIYDVPVKKRGNLKKFKGKTIRVICIGSGIRFCRDYMAGIV